MKKSGVRGLVLVVVAAMLSLVAAGCGGDKKAAEPAKPATKKWLCTVCGYIYEGDELPPDFICPVCKHGAEVFVPLE